VNEKRLRWGILGLGRIARKFVAGLADSATGRLAAAASRDLERAHAFLRDTRSDARAHGDYQALLDDAEVDAVYIATPHPWHAPWTLRAAKAGKHILCEKPLALNRDQAAAMVDAAEANGVFLMEAFFYRCHPQTARLVELVREQAVGELRHLRGAFAFAAPADPESRHRSNALGGGGILDLGCYPVSLHRLLAGAARGARFLDPETVKGVGRLDPGTGVDLGASNVMRFEGGIVAETICGIDFHADNQFELTGTEGRITVPAPWKPSGEIRVARHGREPESIAVPADRHAFSFEIDAVARHRDAGQAPSPAMSWADSLGNMGALDAWRREIGLIYEEEKRGP